MRFYKRVINTFISGEFNTYTRDQVSLSKLCEWQKFYTRSRSTRTCFQMFKRQLARIQNNLIAMQTRFPICYNVI